VVDRAQLADFLRTRREALQPEDVGLPRGARRRTIGLRREEVAALSNMSTDYYSRIEQQRGPIPSEGMLSAITRALHLSLAERDHLFRLAGHTAPDRRLRAAHLDPGTMRILDRLADTPAEVLSSVGETLYQTPPAVALFGDETAFTGLARSAVYRWFTDPAARSLYPEADRPQQGRVLASRLRETYARDGRRSPAAEIVEALLNGSAEFAAIWREHAVGVAYSDVKRLIHPEVGELEVFCQTLLDPDRSQALLVFTAVPGTESHEKLQLLSVLGHQKI
jgi:transcriptional regulator with XRE-family HTH domain